MVTIPTAVLERAREQGLIVQVQVQVHPDGSIATEVGLGRVEHGHTIRLAAWAASWDEIEWPR